MTEKIDLKLTLEAQLEGEQTFSETDAGIRTMRDAVKKFSEAEANGVPVAEAYKEAIDGFRDHALEAGLAIGQMKEAVQDATSAIDRYRLAEAAGLPFDEALLASTEANVAAMEEKAAADTEEAGLLDLLATANWQAALAILGVVAAIGLAVAIMAPFVAITAAAVVLTIAWIVAVAGAILLVAALTLGVLGLGIGMLVLVDTSRVIESRFLVLDAHLKTMYNTLVKQAIPAVKELLDFFDKIIPYIQGFASALIVWFSEELPDILSGISKVLRDLAPDFANFGVFLGRLFDSSKKMGIGDLIEGGIRGAIGAIEGLLTNLLRITQWFKDNPQIMQAAGQVLGWFGDVIQWIAKTWAGWADWITKNWPTIMGLAKVALKEFGDTWSTKVAPVLDQFTQTVAPLIVTMLEYIALHWDAIARVVGFAIIVILAVIVVLLAMGVAFTAVIDWAFSAGQAIVDSFESAKNHVIDAINAIIAAADRIPGVNIPLVGYGGTTGSGSTSESTAKHTATGTRTRSTGAAYRHSGGDVTGGEVYIVGGPGAEEIFIPQSSGKIIPATATRGGGGAGMDTSKIEQLLKMIEAHLAAIKSDTPNVSASSMIRRSA